MSRRPIISALCLAMVGMQYGTAQTASPASNSTASSSAAAPTSSDLKQMQETIALQEEQIKRLQQAVEEQRKVLERSIAASAAAPVTATADGTPVIAASLNTNDKPVNMVPAVNIFRPVSASYPRGGQKTDTENPSPLSITIGNSTFTPLGFVDATFFGRSTNVGSGIGTNFGAIPYNNVATDHVSESNFTTQNSRIGFRVDSSVAGAKVLGYFEADFLGAQPTNVFVTSNADTFRMRNVFIDVQKDGFEILGGQDWSMMTPNRKGLSPLPSDIFYTQNMDTNYQAGLVWARQTQFRFIAHPTDNVAFGVSLENPEQYTGGSAGGSSIVFPNAYNGSSITGQFNNGSNNYGAANLHPDIVFKAAYDGHVGEKVMHVEAAGLVRSFRYAAGLGTPVKYNSTSATAASGEVNANLEVAKGVRLIANTFFGSGNGRYVFGQAPDAVIRANGAISPIHTYSTVDGFEANVTKNTLIYGYYGAIYIGRNVVFDSTAPGSTLAKPVYDGYGFAGSGNTQNRAIQEGTFGLTRTFWKSPGYGSLALITQYSYLTRDPWSVTPTAARNTHTNMYWVDLRYTLP